MKTLLLTSAAALALSMTGPAAFADHHHQDGQERFAFGYGYPQRTRYLTGSAFNSGWTGGGYYNGSFAGSGTSFGWPGNNSYRTSSCSPSFGGSCTTYPSWSSNAGILPGGCVRYGNQTYCPNSNMRIFQPRYLGGY